MNEASSIGTPKDIFVRFVAKDRVFPFDDSLEEAPIVTASADKPDVTVAGHAKRVRACPDNSDVFRVNITELINNKSVL